MLIDSAIEANGRTGRNAEFVPASPARSNPRRMRFGVLGHCALALTLLTSAEATADRPPTRWYGQDILLVDGLSIAVTYLSAGQLMNDSTSREGWAVAMVSGILCYSFGGFTAHWNQGHRLIAFADLAMRVFGPCLAAIFATTAFGGDIPVQDNRQRQLGTATLLAGLPIATLVDVFLFTP